MTTCPICGVAGPHVDGPPIRLTQEQLKDLGIKPEDVTPGGSITMADQDEPKGRYPKQEVSPGQKHGYIGDIEVYDPPEQEPGYSNGETSKVKTSRSKTSAADVTPEEKPIAGSTGLVGGTVDHVSAPKP